VKSYDKSFSSEVVPVSSYMLYLYLATRDDKYLHQAERIMNTVLKKMTDPETNWILESFDKDWNYKARTDNLENEINIGHNLEVVWMFYRLYLLTGNKGYLDSTEFIAGKLINGDLVKTEYGIPVSEEQTPLCIPISGTNFLLIENMETLIQVFFRMEK